LTNLRSLSSLSTGQASRDLQTCESSAPATSQQSMFSVEDFPVSPTPLLADVPAPTTTAISGPSSLDSFASYSPDGSWRKTCQGYSQVMLDGSLERFSETWPRAGMTRNGTAYQRVPLAPLTREIVSGWWPTPQAHDASNRKGQAKRVGDPARHGGWNLEDWVAKWPTPCAVDGKYQASGDLYARVNQVGRQRGVSLARFWTPDANCWKGGNRGNQINQQVSGQLNPTWVEWLMGYPLGWTVCEAWAMRSSRKSRNGSPTGSKKRKG